MSPEQKMLVKQTWQQVVPIADTAARLFYDRPFETDPTARALFNATDLTEQRRKLIQALTTVVRGIDDLEGLVPTLAELGRRHAQYGVANGQYDTVGAAFLWTLEQRLDRHGRHRWRPPGPTPTVAGVMRGATNEPQAKFDDEANRSIQQVPSL